MPPRVAFLEHSASDVPGLLGSRAAELGCDVGLHRVDHGPGALPDPGSVDALVVMGSVASVTDPTVPWLPAERALVSEAVDAGVPVLGVCFGGQLLAEVLGGTVSRAVRPEVGWVVVDTVDPDVVPAGPWLSCHEDAFTAPPGAVALASTAVSLHAFGHGPHLGVQFHPEVTAAVVEAWIADARDGDGLPEGAPEALRAGFAHWDDTYPSRTHRLLDGFLVRAGLVPGARTGG